MSKVRFGHLACWFYFGLAAGGAYIAMVRGTVEGVIVAALFAVIMAISLGVIVSTWDAMTENE